MSSISTTTNSALVSGASPRRVLQFDMEGLPETPSPITLKYCSPKRKVAALSAPNAPNKKAKQDKTRDAIIKAIEHMPSSKFARWAEMLRGHLPFCHYETMELAVWLNISGFRVTTVNVHVKNFFTPEQSLRVGLVNALTLSMQEVREVKNKIEQVYQGITNPYEDVQGMVALGDCDVNSKCCHIFSLEEI